MATQKRHSIIILYLPEKLHNPGITQLWSAGAIHIHMGHFWLTLVQGGTDLSSTDFGLGFSF